MKNGQDSIVKSASHVGGQFLPRDAVWKSWKLIAWTISPTPSHFLAQRPSTYSQRNMRKFGENRIEVWWEKVACWSTKPAISLKRVEIEEKLLRVAYKNSPTLFRTVPSPTPTASSSPRLGVRSPHRKLQSLLSQERVKLRTLNIWPVHSQGPSE